MYNLCQSVLTCVFKLGTKLWLISQIMSQFTSVLKHVLECFPEKTSDFAVVQKWDDHWDSFDQPQRSQRCAAEKRASCSCGWIWN